MTDPWAAAVQEQVDKETERRMSKMSVNSSEPAQTGFGGNTGKMGEFNAADFPIQSSSTTAFGGSTASGGAASKGFGGASFGSFGGTGEGASSRRNGSNGFGSGGLGSAEPSRPNGFGRGTSFGGGGGTSPATNHYQNKSTPPGGRGDVNRLGNSTGLSTTVGETKNQNPAPSGTPADTEQETGGLDDDLKGEIASSEEQKATASFLNKILHNQLVKVQEHNIEVRNMQRDESSPLFSVKTFQELHLKPELVRALTDMGFSLPSKIQEVTLPVLVSEPPTNMIAQSQSGTGKTAAFVLTMLNRVDPSLHHPQCLCLAPTYELAKQIGEVVEKMGRYLSECSIRYAVRGCRLQRGETVSEQIIIGTPGTALDWIIKFRAFDPSLLKVFVLDEADVMISQQGHRDQSIRIKKNLSKDCQLLLFSATYDEEVMNFAENGVMRDTPSVPAIITVRREEQTLDNIKQYYVECGSREDKFRAICNIYGCLTIGQSIIFCHTRKSASWLAQQMGSLGHSVSLLSGDLDITQRADIIGRFKAAKEKVMITTNVCARGIDVAQVTLVINYDLPILVEVMEDGRVQKKGADVETYLHRIGRTGRFGKEGIAVNFIDSSWSLDRMKEIEQYFGIQIERLDTDSDTDMEKLEKTVG